MKAGVHAGPVWVSSGGRTKRRRVHHRIGWWVVFGVLLMGAHGWVTAAVWTVWIGAAMLLVLATARALRARRRRAARRPVSRATPTQPLNPRMYYSDRR